MSLILMEALAAAPAAPMASLVMVVVRMLVLVSLNLLLTCGRRLHLRRSLMGVHHLLAAGSNDVTFIVNDVILIIIQPATPSTPIAGMLTDGVVVAVVDDPEFP